MAETILYTSSGLPNLEGAKVPTRTTRQSMLVLHMFVSIVPV